MAPIETQELEQKTKESTDLVLRAKQLNVISNQMERNSASDLAMALRAMRKGLSQSAAVACARSSGVAVTPKEMVVTPTRTGTNRLRAQQLVKDLLVI